METMTDTTAGRSGGEHPVAALPASTARRGSPAGAAAGAAALAVGAALLGISAAVLQADSVVIWRVLAGLAGLVAVYLGVRQLGRVVWGAAWDAAYWLSIVWLVLVVSAALLAPVLPLGEASDSARTLAEPILARPSLSGGHLLGTNNLGLDMLARTIYGARVSLLMSVVAVTIGMVIGGGIGTVAGYLKGRVDTAVGIGTNVLLAFPPLVLLLTLAAVMPRSTRNLAVALGVLAIPVNIRLARANVIAVAQQEFVLAASSIGASKRRIMVRELLPNVAIPLISYGLIIVAVVIVAEASLSFLGLGVQPPEPSWGNMIAEGQNGMFEANPHLVLVPGACLFLTVFSFNVAGERLRQRLGGPGAGS